MVEEPPISPGKTALLKERDFLKAELQALKQCQVQYFAVTITTAGVVIGLAEKIGQADSGIIYLAPLLIILPCWTIFFDKATTISRIVGYLRILERLLAGKSSYQYIGWENALREFRRAEQKGRKGLVPDWGEMVRNSLRAVCLLIDFRRVHRYWTVNWLTFFGLAVCCLGLAWVHSKGFSGPWWLFSVISLLSALHNGDVLWSLVKGRCSYDEREKMWAELLRGDGVEQEPQNP